MLALVIVMVFIALWQVPRLIKKKQIRELVAFSALWVMAFIYSALNILDIELNPINAIINLLSSTN